MFSWPSRRWILKSLIRDYKTLFAATAFWVSPAGSTLNRRKDGQFKLCMMIGRGIKPSSCNLVAICWTELILHERLLYISMLTKHMLVSKCWSHVHCHWIVNNACLCGDWGYRLLGLVHVPIQFQWIWQLSISRMEIKFVSAIKSLSQLYYFQTAFQFYEASFRVGSLPSHFRHLQGRCKVCYTEWDFLINKSCKRPDLVLHQVFIKVDSFVPKFMQLRLVLLVRVFRVGAPSAPPVSTYSGKT